MSHLILPQQRGERDQCHMTEDGEVGLFEACDSHDLLTLGWIHTHPCQACFMSSVDLHTHCGYQTMLPEVGADRTGVCPWNSLRAPHAAQAVAIVMAPNDARLRCVPANSRAAARLTGPSPPPAWACSASRRRPGCS